MSKTSSEDLADIQKKHEVVSADIDFAFRINGNCSGNYICCSEEFYNEIENSIDQDIESKFIEKTIHVKSDLFKGIALNKKNPEGNSNKNEEVNFKVLIPNEELKSFLMEKKRLIEERKVISSKVTLALLKEENKILKKSKTTPKKNNRGKK